MVEAVHRKRVTPSSCGKCRRIFMANPTLQAEMRHIAAKFGPRAAESELNDRLEEQHGEH